LISFFCMALSSIKLVDCPNNSVNRTQIPPRDLCAGYLQRYTAGTLGDIMTRMIFCVVMFSLAAMTCMRSQAANAKEMTASDLQQVCSSQNPDVDAPCRFYIMGILQGVTIGIAMADGQVTGGRPCIPDNVQDTTLERVVKAKLGADLMVYPQDRNMPASSFVGGVIANVFACNKTKKWSVRRSIKFEVQYLVERFRDSELQPLPTNDSMHWQSGCDSARYAVLAKTSATARRSRRGSRRRSSTWRSLRETHCHPFCSTPSRASSGAKAPQRQRSPGGLTWKNGRFELPWIDTGRRRMRTT